MYFSVCIFHRRRLSKTYPTDKGGGGRRGPPQVLLLSSTPRKNDEPQNVKNEQDVWKGCFFEAFQCKPGLHVPDWGSGAVAGQAGTPGWRFHWSLLQLSFASLPEWPATFMLQCVSTSSGS